MVLRYVTEKQKEYIKAHQDSEKTKQFKKALAKKPRQNRALKIKRQMTMQMVFLMSADGK